MVNLDMFDCLKLLELVYQEMEEIKAKARRGGDPAYWAGELCQLEVIRDKLREGGR